MQVSNCESSQQSQQSWSTSDLDLLNGVGGWSSVLGVAVASFSGAVH